MQTLPSNRKLGRVGVSYQKVEEYEFDYLEIPISLNIHNLMSKDIRSFIEKNYGKGWEDPRSYSFN